MKKRICVIGSGFAGLSAACYLAKEGYRVTILEKNEAVGGRARKLSVDGFHFDMGPSWYWMPDVFERFFNHFGKKASDYYELIRLDPSYAVKFKDELISIPAEMEAFEAMCERIEPGSAQSLRKFLSQAQYKYEVGIHDLVHKPGRSLMEFMDVRLLYGLTRMDVLTSMRKHVHRYFKTPKLRELMEFPILFLGSTPDNTPALYSLMNYADISLGTWYPMGGMNKVIEAMVSLARELGVEILTDQKVTAFQYQQGRVNRVVTATETFEADVVVAGADYHHVDQYLVAPEYRQYSEKYWNGREMAPSSLLFYLGVKKELPRMLHHVLFFDEDFNHHAHEIYHDPKWPTKPLLYTSATGKTDPEVAPPGHENLVVLIPVAPGLEDTEEIREQYFDLVMDRLEHFNETNIRDHLVVKKSFAHKDFIEDYHSFKGNAYGLANTLRQTAILKPRLKSKKLKNLYHTGQLTVPGPGVPPSLISGEVVSKEICREFA